MARAIVHVAAALTCCLCLSACAAVGDVAPIHSSQPTPTVVPTPQPTSFLPTPAQPRNPTQPPASPGCGPTGGIAVFAAFRMCGTYEWEPSLMAVIEATNKDKNNFCSSYESTSQNDFAPPWQLVINIVQDADPRARARVAALIPDGAPVIWHVVKYSCKDLMDVIKGARMHGFEQAGGVVSVALDTLNDRVVVTTHGDQPDLAARIEQAFGDKVTVVATDNPPLAL